MTLLFLLGEQSAKISNSLGSLIMFVPLCSPLACNLQVSWVTLNILWYLIILVKPKYHVENHQRTIHLSRRILIWIHSLSIKHATSYNITASQHASYTKCCMIHTKHCKVYTTVAYDKHSILNLSIFFSTNFYNQTPCRPVYPYRLSVFSMDLDLKLHTTD